MISLEIYKSKLDPQIEIIVELNHYDYITLLTAWPICKSPFAYGGPSCNTNSFPFKCFRCHWYNGFRCFWWIVITKKKSFIILSNCEIKFNEFELKMYFSNISIVLRSFGFLHKCWKFCWRHIQCFGINCSIIPVLNTVFTV